MVELRRSFSVVGILGLGKTARRLAQTLHLKGSQVRLYDDHSSQAPRRSLVFFRQLGQEVFGPLEVERFLDGVDIVIPSPGFSPFHPVLSLVKDRRIPIMSELDLGVGLLEPLPKLIAVTGTNGKTSVCYWIQELLSQVGVRVFRAGNEGPPFTRFMRRAGAFQAGVLEVSSFQLAQSQQFLPDIFLLTEILPDHLLWHGSLEAYRDSKLSILKRLGPEGTAIVLNPDESTQRVLQESGSRVWVVGKRLPFAYGSLLWNESSFFVETPGIRLHYPIPKPKGLRFFPLENRLLAGLAAFVFSDNPAVFSLLEDLDPLSYRISFEGFFKGAYVFNDSKATNVSSVEMALRLVSPPILWIGGGLAKGNSFAPLRPYVKAKVRQALFFGAARGILAEEFEGLVPYESFSTLEDLILSLPDVVKPGDRVLFSPGCASFDAFRSFRHRGLRFSRLIASLGLR